MASGPYHPISNDFKAASSHGSPGDSRKRWGNAVYVNPVIFFYILNILLIGGALQLYTFGAGPPTEISWMALSILALGVGQLWMSWTGCLKSSGQPNTGNVVALEIFCITLIALCTTDFFRHGIPLLSEFVNIERMTFYSGGGLLAKAYPLLYFVVIIGLLIFLIEGRRRFLYYVLAAVVELLFTGSKANMISAGVCLTFSYWCARRPIPARVLIVASISGALGTLVLFAVVSGSNGVLSELMSRLLSVNEMGLRICVKYARELGPKPAYLAFEMTRDRLSGTQIPYPISTGRYITAAFYHIRNAYLMIWEMTVTGYCDSLLLGGQMGLFLYAILLPCAVIFCVWKMAVSQTVLGRGLYAKALYDLFLLHEGGNFAAQILGMIGQSWVLLGGLLLFSHFMASMVSRVRHGPMQGNDPAPSN